MDINGRTRLTGLLGNPVEHTLSPLIHNTLNEILKINDVYVPFHTTSEGLEAAVSGAYELNILGLNATVPHKNNVMKYLCDIDDAGKTIGAVNTLVRTSDGYKGYNTDMPGLLREIKTYGIDISDREIIILGAGGAAKAVAYMCMSENASHIYILNRTLSKAEDIASHMNEHFGRNAVTAGTLDLYKTFGQKKYIVFQSTSIGLYPHDSEAVIEDNSFYQLVETGIDLVYNPFETSFMKRCREAGAKAYNGLKMLLYQGIIAYELWNNISIDENIAEVVYNKLLKKARNNIILTGFMGCGKSTTGALLAEKYGYKLIDTDKFIEEKEGCAISDIFARKGEAYFRELETDALRELNETLSNTVISTGGGLPLRDENRELLSSLGYVIYLEVEPAEVIRRLSGDTTRPLLQGDNPENKIREMMEYRHPIYKCSADKSVNVTGKSVDDIVGEIINGYSKA
ncbi:MAG: shikimate dehydrogenase [Coprococcus sp.]